MSNYNSTNCKMYLKKSFNKNSNNILKIKLYIKLNTNKKPITLIKKLWKCIV